MTTNTPPHTTLRVVRDARPMAALTDAQRARLTTGVQYVLMEDDYTVVDVARTHEEVGRFVVFMAANKRLCRVELIRDRCRECGHTPGTHAVVCTRNHHEETTP